MTPAKVLIGQILIVLGIVVTGVWCATQWSAAALGFQMRLGAPWFELFDTPVYYPWRFLEWWYAYDAYAPAIFNTAGMIAGSSAVLAALAAVMASVWRARQARRVTTYGSARWATAQDIKAAGLHATAGIFLGQV